MSSKKFKKIVILSGGVSEEKDISKLTANEVYKILRTKYNVELLNVTHNSKKLIDSLVRINPDVAFNCLHGFFGEDGQIQSILNFLRIPYTHSGVMTSSVLMNKKISKIIFSSGSEVKISNLWSGYLSLLLLRYIDQSLFFINSKYLWEGIEKSNC